MLAVQVSGDSIKKPLCVGMRNSVTQDVRVIKEKLKPHP